MGEPMKKTGKCPMCGGMDILVIPGSWAAQWTKIGGGLFSVLTVDRHCCVSCGYT